MKITVLCVGKIKERYFTDAIAEYSKRLGRYVTLQIVEVADEKTPDGASEALEEQIRTKEGERLMKYLNKDAYRIALAIDGKMRESVDLSKHIEQLGVRGNSHIIFVIGGSLGLSAQVLKECDEQLSFSPMTFPHQLMRVILLEQIYRAYRIMNHEPYHK
jgi:23S rRNA (pseudouridine1915-N3)-methyltransferase